MSKLTIIDIGNLLKTWKNIKHDLICVAHGGVESYVFVFELDK